mgnify:CR=1 FL=1
MIEIFLGGLAFGLLMGILFTKIHMENEIEDLEHWIDEQDELIAMQNEFIELFNNLNDKYKEGKK